MRRFLNCWRKAKKFSLKFFIPGGKWFLKKIYDPGFGPIIHWDVPLLEGYDYTSIKNTEKISLILKYYHFFILRHQTVFLFRRNIRWVEKTDE